MLWPYRLAPCPPRDVHMSSSDRRRPVDAADPAGNAELTPVLGRLTGRRRRLLSVLAADAPLGERALAARLAAAEADEADVDPETVASVRTELRQVHLPVLADLGLLERADGRVDVADHPLYDDRRFHRLLEADADVDGLLECLADERRRRVLAALLDREEPVAREDLAGAVADESTADCRTALHHRHLPKLDTHGLVEYDAGTGRVVPTLSATDAEWVERLLD